MKSKALLSVLIPSLILFPLVSFAAIYVPNPDAIFPSSDFMKILDNVVKFIVSFVAILGIIFIVWGGIQYVTSAGDDNKTEEAKNIIMYALIGLFTAAMAYALETLVLKTIILGA